MDFNGLEYEKKVYAAVLGKVAGVYFGRPIEGWSKEKIEEKFGFVDRYVAADQNVPLIVADDDISGTLTFIRALADSGLYEKTPADFFGDNWLNYLLEEKTVLWWGGMCRSTEHTAYLRLKQGVRAPESGSMKLNGKVVSEQIGAQIFIDAFGMVAPGRPELAAELADRAARVSHDGEAVYGARVVAAMVAEAFVSDDMEHVLDVGVSVIPPDCMIAAVHRDVRAWAKEDGDWRRTYGRIKQKYGYDKFGGGCHMIPNHALMVMAWSYGQNDFHKALSIANTAGWDTDCNAANVGSVSALICGLDAMRRPYDFLTPFSDRVFIPTADGTQSCSDCVTEAYRIAAIGRRIMKAPALPERPYFNFSLPGSRQGFMADDPASVKIENHGNGLEIRPVTLPCRVMRNTLIPGNLGSYSTPGTPLFYPGMGIRVKGVCLSGTAVTPVFESVAEGAAEAKTTECAEAVLKPGEPFDFTAVPDLPPDRVVTRFGFLFKPRAEIRITSVEFVGAASLRYEGIIPAAGWLTTLHSRWGNSMGRNEGRGIFLTGNRFWTDIDFTTAFSIHHADRCGLIVRYQGMERYYALIFEEDKVRFVKRCYGKETVLAEAGCTPVPDEWFQVTVRAHGAELSAEAGGVKLEAEDRSFETGGAGFLTEMGVCAHGAVEIRAAVAYH